MGTADTIMVSFVGEFAVSGVNIIDNINNLLIIAFTALSTGGAVVVSQYIGSWELKNASQAGRQLFYMSALVSLFIMVISLSFRHSIIRLFYGNIESDVMNAAAVYFLITAFSFPCLAIYSATAALFRAEGNSKVTMLIALLANIINITGNWFFIYKCNMGAAGAALSTLLCRLMAAFVLTYMLIHKNKGLISLVGLFKVKLVLPTLRKILRIGVPSGLEGSMFQIGRLLTQRIFTSFGTAALAANAVTTVINSISIMPGNAFGIALLTVVGQCTGAGDYETAKQLTAKLMKIAFLTIFCMSFFVFIFMENLLGFFNLSPEAHELARTFTRVHCISMAIGWVFSFALPNALRAAGDNRFVMLAAAISMWTVRVSAAYFLVYVLGVGPISVWIAMGGDFLVRGTCYLVRWRRGKWQNIMVI